MAQVMNGRGRTGLRRSFFEGDRRLEVYFYTSSIEKFLQARTVFDRAGLILRHWKSRADPYEEDYRGGTEALLSRAIEEVAGAVGRSMLFFVEDTSLRIEALSDGPDFPGLGVKEWFASTSFEEVDDSIRSRGNDRRATVRSDIALHVPGLSGPVLFHGETRGEIADTAPSFDRDPIHPWLTPKTFNGWIRPNGASRRLGEMSLEESWQHDFRINSLQALIERLEEYAAALNFAPQTYSRRRLANASEAQLTAFAESSIAFAVIGYPCAGKTTFGDHAAATERFRFIEASAVMRLLGEAYSGPPLQPAELADWVTTTMGFDAIALRVMQLAAEDPTRPAVVTGFRFIEEIEALKRRMPSATVVFVAASERTRFERCLARKRADSPQSIAAFGKVDESQAKFGLLPVGEAVADIVIENEGSLAEYHTQIRAVLEGATTAGVTRSTGDRRLVEGQLFRLLDTLTATGMPMGTDELEDATNATGSRIRHNNANKVLKKVPALATRFDLSGSRVRYQVTEHGRALVRLRQTLFPSETRTEPEVGVNGSEGRESTP